MDHFCHSVPGYDQQDAASKLRTQGIEPRLAGNRLKAEGPFGDFVLQEKSGKRALMIATGTGVSPIKEKGFPEESLHHENFF